MHKREHNQLRLLLSVLQQYDHAMPLSRFLGLFYKQNKQMGSRDRRILSQSLYNYFRLGSALRDLSIEQKLGISTYLCNSSGTSFSDFLIAEYTSLDSANQGSGLEQKIQDIQKAYPSFDPKDIFPFADLMPEHLHSTGFYSSLLVQPHVWIRTRKACHHRVIEELQDTGIAFEIDTELENCIAVSSGTSLNTLSSFGKGYFEIQDRSSQSTGQSIDVKNGMTVWDCCAASGGKSLMMTDKEPGINLTVSDIRPSILSNLEERFRKAEISRFKALVIDLADLSDLSRISEKFDLIVADVPCSGSGTWGRTPEMISSFKIKELDTYSKRQKQIVLNTLEHLKPGGQLIYITCSVFKAENEEVISYLLENSTLRLEENRHINGYSLGADNMFFAKLVKE